MTDYRPSPPEVKRAAETIAELMGDHSPEAHRYWKSAAEAVLEAAHEAEIGTAA